MKPLTSPRLAAKLEELDDVAPDPIPGFLSAGEANARAMQGIDLTNPEIRTLMQQLNPNELVDPRRRARYYILVKANEAIVKGKGPRRVLRMKHLQQAVNIVRSRRLVGDQILELAGFNAAK